MVKLFYYMINNFLTNTFIIFDQKPTYFSFDPTSFFNILDPPLSNVCSWRNSFVSKC